MKFLTKALKEKYMEDFNTNVLNSTDLYWGIDNGLRNILIEINKNVKVQTLYSKNFNDVDCASYLMVCIDRGYLNKINKIAKNLTDNSECFDFMVIEPKIFDANSTEKMACNYDKDYFNISVFSFFCESDDSNDHRNFWLFLLENLVK
jgi:hypothetical protein